MLSQDWDVHRSLSGFMQSHGTHPSQFILQQGRLPTPERGQAEQPGQSHCGGREQQQLQQLNPCSAPLLSTGSAMRAGHQQSSNCKPAFPTNSTDTLKKASLLPSHPLVPQASSAGKSHPPSHTAQSRGLMVPGRKCFNHTLAPAAPGPACHRIWN